MRQQGSRQSAPAVPAGLGVLRDAALRIVLTYAAFAALWILLSDKIVAWLFPDPQAMALASTAKGWAFVAATSVLLYGLIRQLLDQATEGAPAPAPATTMLPVARAVALVIGLTALGVIYTLQQAGAGQVPINTALTALAGLMAIFVVAVGGFFSHQQRELALALRDRELQAERLRASQLLQGISEGSNDAIFAKDLEGRYLLFNREAARLTGKSAEEVLGEDDRSLFPPEQAEQLMALGREVVVSDRIVTAEERLATVDGERVFLATKGPLHDAEGKVVGIFGISRDITERIRSERELRERLELRERFAHVADNVPGLIYSFRVRRDGVGAMPYAGPAIGEIYGVSAEEVAEDITPIIKRTPAEDAVRIAASIEASARNMTPWQGESRYNHPVKGLRWLEGRSTPCREADGSIIWHGFVMDITERKIAEQALREREGLYRLVSETGSDIIWLYDLRAQRFSYVSPSVEPLLGFRIEEALTHSLEQTLDPASFHRISREALLDVARFEAGDDAARTRTLEVMQPHKDGRFIPFEAVITLVADAKRRVTHVQGVSRDISEKKRIEAELERHRLHLEDLVAARTAELAEARARAEAANRAKSAFLANMSHEIRTPMNAIVGLAELMRGSGLAPKQADRLGKINAAARHLLSVINDILDFSKIEAGHVHLDEVEFSLEGVLERVRRMVADDAVAKSLTITIEAPALPHALRGDPVRLGQALLNYAANAVKFTERGSICLRARLINRSEDIRTLRFEVQDTGIGIDTNTLEHLFQPFEQADASTTRRFGGTGLGLAITRHLAQLMGGDAGVQSVAGQGSTFWFTACLREGSHGGDAEHQAPQDPEQSLRREFHGTRVLLAEDNLINREVARELLQRCGLAVDVALNGREAVAMAETNPYRLILMDMQMPELDGIDAARAIRANAGMPRMPIIALTANAFEEDRRACLAAGMDDFIAKPVSPDALYATLLLQLRGAACGSAPQPASLSVQI